MLLDSFPSLLLLVFHSTITITDMRIGYTVERTQDLLWFYYSTYSVNNNNYETSERKKRYSLYRVI